MLAILNYLNAHNLPIVQLIVMIFVSKFMIHKGLYDKTYLPFGLLSPLIYCVVCECIVRMLCALRRLYEDWVSTGEGIKEQRYKGGRLLGRLNVCLLVFMH